MEQNSKNIEKHELRISAHDLMLRQVNDELLIIQNQNKTK